MKKTSAKEIDKNQKRADEAAPYHSEDKEAVQKKAILDAQIARLKRLQQFTQPEFYQAEEE